MYCDMDWVALSCQFSILTTVGGGEIGIVYLLCAIGKTKINKEKTLQTLRE